MRQDFNVAVGLYVECLCRIQGEMLVFVGNNPDGAVGVCWHVL